ncbi:MAG: GGDEF domain-containing protein [Burkholderiales bacterium]
MIPSSSTAVAALRQLQLDDALALLEQAGALLPDAEPYSVRWLQGIVDALSDLSNRDPLTGLVNRRSFEMTLEREIDRVARAGEPALLLMLDIDHFKKVNDTHGHPAGDSVIRAVADAVTQSVRPMDTVARTGGEEFAVVLPNCPSSFGPTVAERIRATVAAMVVPVSPSVSVSVTVSLGGAFAPQWIRSSPLLWMERTDRQLYRAKAEGRNRACFEPQVESLVTADEKSMLFAVNTPEEAP